jgi:CheY-like chemotaxis protein
MTALPRTAIRAPRPRILCVDDEPQVLDGLVLHLRSEFQVVTATSGADGIAELEKGTFAVIISDMRMPRMDGAAFLRRAREIAPDTTRILLTGQTDLQSAISVVNDGQIFRFLSKPCQPDRLAAMVRAGAEQHRLVTAERELLESTLRGSILALTDLLALAHPVAFGRAGRIKQHVTEICDALGVTERWHLEVAAMLSQLGCVILPSLTAEKLYFQQPMTAEEAEQVRKLPDMVQQLLGHIPRLEPVLGLLSERPAPTVDRRAHQILRVAVAYDLLEGRGSTPQEAVDTLRGRGGYDASILDALAECKRTATAAQDIREVPFAAVRVGMIFADDVRTGTGTLMVARGYEVTESFVARAATFGPGHVREPVRVIVPRPK